MLPEKYEPKSTRHIVGNKKQIGEIRNFLNSWKNNRPALRPSALLVHGPTGCGKTLAVKLVAKELEFEVVESCASDKRDKEGFEDLINVSKQAGIFSKKRIILVEDAELIESKSSLLKLIAESGHPVVITAERPYELNMAALLKLCRAVKFRKADDDSVFRFLKSVCDAESIGCSDKAIMDVVKSANGDIRAALIDLEAGPGLRENRGDILEIVRAIFRKDRSAEKLLDGYQDFDKLFAWLGENIQHEFSKQDDMAKAYDYLSKADVFRARIIRRQAWNLQKYFIDLLINMPASGKRLPAMYRPPARIKKMSQQALGKIGSRLHVSKKDSAGFLPVIKLFLDDTMTKEFDLDQDDVEFIKNIKQ